MPDEPKPTNASIDMHIRAEQDPTGIGTIQNTPYTALVQLILKAGLLVVFSAALLYAAHQMFQNMAEQNRQILLDRKEEAKSESVERKEEAARVEKSLEREYERREKQRDRDETRTQNWFKAIQERHTEDGNKTRGVLTEMLRVQEANGKTLEKIAAMPKEK